MEKELLTEVNDQYHNTVDNFKQVVRNQMDIHRLGLLANLTIKLGRKLTDKELSEFKDESDTLFCDTFKEMGKGYF